MGKFLLIAWIWTGALIGHSPSVAVSSEHATGGLDALSKVDALALDHQAVTFAEDFDRQSFIGTKLISLEFERLAVGPDLNLLSRSSSSITDENSHPATLHMLYGKGKRGREAEGHHRDTAACSDATQASKHHAYTCEENPEGGEESNPAVQPEGFQLDPIAEADSSSVGPLSTEVGFLKSVWLLVTISSIVFGTVYAIIAVGLAMPILTRRWYTDAFLGYVVALSGFVALFNTLFVDPV